MRIFWLFFQLKNWNLGDVALNWGISKWLNETFPNTEIIKYPVEIMVSSANYQAIKKNFIDNIKKGDVVLMHECCLGSFCEHVNSPAHLLYRLRTETYEGLKGLPNKIIQLPATLYYDLRFPSVEECLKNDGKAFDNPNLTFCVRDSVSFQIAKKLFGECRCNIILMPDFTYYLASEVQESTMQRENICLVVRNSKLRDLMLRRINQATTLNVVKKDLNFSKKINVEDDVKAIWKQYQSYKLVVTDRLHGVIFSALTGTPCIGINYNQRPHHFIPHKTEQKTFYPSLKCVSMDDGFHKAIEVLSQPVKTKNLNSYFSFLKEMIEK